MKKLILLLAILAQVTYGQTPTLTVSDTTYSLSGSELLTIANSYAEGYQAALRIGRTEIRLDSQHDGGFQVLHSEHGFALGTRVSWGPRSSSGVTPRIYRYNGNEREIDISNGTGISYDGASRPFTWTITRRDRNFFISEEYTEDGMLHLPVYRTGDTIDTLPFRVISISSIRFANHQNIYVITRRQTGSLGNRIWQVQLDINGSLHWF